MRGKVAQYFGVPTESITIEEMMDLRQAQKAIQSGDTPAYKAVKEQAYGQPKQEINIEANLTKPVIIDWSDDPANNSTPNPEAAGGETAT